MFRYCYTGNAESNPGPHHHHIAFVCLNTRSAAGIIKFTLIHNAVNDHSHDVLALTETWIPQAALTAIRSGIAPYMDMNSLFIFIDAIILTADWSSFINVR
jgi:hypothetical protein